MRRREVIKLAGAPLAAMTIPAARVRGAACSLSVVFLWGGNYLVSQFFPAMLATLAGNVFYCYALMCLICFIFIHIFAPETKGKTLEQIEGELFGSQAPREVR